MFSSRRALATAILLLLLLVGSAAIYYLNSEAVQREVVVRNVYGQVIQTKGEVSVGYYYPSETTGLIFFKPGQSFYVFLYLTGFGTVQSIGIDTVGFNGSVVAPLLPLKVDNATEPSVAILQINVLRCCFNGTVGFTVNAN